MWLAKCSFKGSQYEQTEDPFRILHKLLLIQYCSNISSRANILGSWVVQLFACHQEVLSLNPSDATDILDQEYRTAEPCFNGGRDGIPLLSVNHSEIIQSVSTYMWKRADSAFLKKYNQLMSNILKRCCGCFHLSLRKHGW